MGFIYAKEFLVHFFATEKWYPHDSEFYEVGETLYNDWVTALPKNAQPKLIKRPKRDPETGMWHYSVSTEGDAIAAKMGVPLACTSTGVKHLHHKARRSTFRLTDRQIDRQADRPQSADRRTQTDCLTGWQTDRSCRR